VPAGGRDGAQGDLVLTLGAGSIGGAASRILAALEGRAS
jgi:hypothetical protein